MLIYRGLEAEMVFDACGRRGVMFLVANLHPPRLCGGFRTRGAALQHKLVKTRVFYCRD